MKSKYTVEEWQKIIAEYKSTHAVTKITKKYGISKSTLYEWCTKLIYKDRKYSKTNYSNTDIYLLERKIQVLEKENSIFRDCGYYINASNDDKYNAILNLKDKYSITDLCNTLQFSKGTYYNRLLRSPKKKKIVIDDENFAEIVKKHFDNSKGRFGPRKIHALMKEDGYKIGIERITRLMKENNLVPKLSKRPLPQAHRDFQYRLNRLRRIFKQDEPNQTWVSDITYVVIEKEIYGIAVIIDLYARKVVAHCVSKHFFASTMVTLFNKAFYERGCPPNLMFHSDQGTQYTSYEFRSFLRKLGVKQSFSNPGCPVDNAVAEGFFSCMKREEISHNLYHSMNELKTVVDDYIYFFNNMRPHKKLKNMTPVEYETEYYKKISEGKLDDCIPY